MYLAHITLFCVLCIISEQTTFDKSGQGVTNVTAHPIPGGTTNFKFNDNFITFVPTNYFRNLSNLYSIYLQKNLISDIEDTAFSEVPSLRRVYLLYNKLSVIRKLMFSGLPNLSMLWLNSNQIHTIEQGSFKGNNALGYLALSSNSLATVNRSMFDPNDPNNHPTNLDDFYMFGNALQCDTLCWVKQAGWITVYRPDLTTCDGPASLAGCKWDSLTEPDLCGTPGWCLSFCLSVCLEPDLAEGGSIDMSGGPISHLKPEKKSVFFCGP